MLTSIKLHEHGQGKEIVYYAELLWGSKAKLTHPYSITYHAAIRAFVFGSNRIKAYSWLGCWAREESPGRTCHRAVTFVEQNCGR